MCACMCVCVCACEKFNEWTKGIVVNFISFTTSVSHKRENIKSSLKQLTCQFSGIFAQLLANILQCENTFSCNTKLFIACQSKSEIEIKIKNSSQNKSKQKHEQQIAREELETKQKEAKKIYEKVQQHKSWRFVKNRRRFFLINLEKQRSFMDLSTSTQQDMKLPLAQRVTSSSCHASFGVCMCVQHFEET